MTTGNIEQNVAEKTRYTRYYEHDGMLRAYANRSMVLAMVFAVIALGSFAFAVYVRLQPPTVIRVDSDGEATIVAGTPVPGHSGGLNFVAVGRGGCAHRSGSQSSGPAISRPLLELYARDRGPPDGGRTEHDDGKLQGACSQPSA